MGELGKKPSLRCMLGVDAECAEEARRRTEFRYFLAYLASLKANDPVAEATAS